MTKPASNEITNSLARSGIFDVVIQELASTRFIDMHTHLFPPTFGDLALRGIDELLTYHYLEAEFFRSSRLKPERYWRLTKTERADAIWRTLFVEATPISEAAHGIITLLKLLGLSVTAPDLREAREFFAAQEVEAHTARVLELAGIDKIVMTNDPLDPSEVAIWETRPVQDNRYRAALRLDRLLNEWPAHWQKLASKGYSVTEDASGKSMTEVRRFLIEWLQRLSPAYMAVSLPDSFSFPEESVRSRLLDEAILPSCQEANIPLSLMIGVRRQVNPALKLAGDGMGRANLQFLEHLCREYPDNRFLISVLSRENQHELCVYARKFSNLMPFGCWWFVNQPSIVDEITTERLEMLGLSFIPQHSDARVLEQLIYKWHSTRQTLAPILAKAYSRLCDDGLPITRAQIARDIRRLFRVNFEEFSGFSAGG
jgi:hypothetical protein